MKWNGWRVALLTLLLWSASVSAAGCQDFTVALDIGHQIQAPGAISARGRGEFFFNRDLAYQIRDELQRQGIGRVLLINEAGDSVDLTERGRRAARGGANLLLSIHHDSVQPRHLTAWSYEGRALRYSDRFSGYSLFYSARNPAAAASLAVARRLGAALRRAGLTPSLHHAEAIPGEKRELVDPALGIYRFDELKVLRNAPLPAVLLEAGVIVNRTEEARLSEPAYRARLAAAVTEAVRRECGS